jgi:hypothetical protein
VNRRYLVLLSDVLLIGEPPVPLPGKKPSGKDKINVKQARDADTEDWGSRRRRRTRRDCSWVGESGARRAVHVRQEWRDTDTHLPWNHHTHLPLQRVASRILSFII